MGGVKPRHAYVDLKLENLSPEIQKVLLPGKRSHSTNLKMAQSRKLVVYFSNNDFMMVSPYVETKSKWKRVRSSTYGVLKRILKVDESRPTIYAIHSAEWGLIAWCDIANEDTSVEPEKIKGKPSGLTVGRSK
jgi:hypothetical protein